MQECRVHGRDVFVAFFRVPIRFIHMSQVTGAQGAGGILAWGRFLEGLMFFTA